MFDPWANPNTDLRRCMKLEAGYRRTKTVPFSSNLGRARLVSRSPADQGWGDLVPDCPCPGRTARGARREVTDGQFGIDRETSSYPASRIAYRHSSP